MARINIEDTLWGDPRFQELMVKVGDRHRAKGMVLELYTVAQRFWLISRGRGIPKPAWSENGLPNELIECRLARDDGEFYYATGSKEAFAWITSSSENGKKGGPAAAKARRENKGKSKRQKSSKVVEASSENDDSRPLPPSPSPSLPLSPSSGSISDSEFYSVGEAAPPAEIKNPVGYFIGTYVRAFQERYGKDARPELGGQVQGRLKSYVKDTPIERACAMIRTYCEMGDAWFLTKGHDFETFMQNLTKVGLKLDTGKTVTRTQAQQADKASHAQDQLKRIAEGTL